MHLPARPWPAPATGGTLWIAAAAALLVLSPVAAQELDELDEFAAPEPEKTYCYLIYGKPMGNCSPGQERALLDADPSRTMLPAEGIDPADIDPVRPTETVELTDNDVFAFSAEPVSMSVHGNDLILYGYDGSIPGPTLITRQGSTVILDFANRIDHPTTIHWHGIRVQDRYDGTPYYNQDPIEPGEDFRYFLWTRDAGIFWYHSHFREDMQQNAGLYGAIIVRPVRTEDWPQIHSESVLVLSDLLIDEDGLVPYGEIYANHALSGRIGNHPLINGRDHYEREAQRGEVVRFYMVNAANARPFHVTFDGASVKRIGGDIGLYEREEWVDEVVLFPGQRRIVDVRFDEARTYTLRHEAGGQRWEMATVSVTDTPATPDLEAAYDALMEHPSVIRDIDRFRIYFDRPVDRQLLLTMRTAGDPGDAAARGAPADVTIRDAQWVIADAVSGDENLGINMNFRVGDVVKLLITNDADVPHPTTHTLHLHGQRFLILHRDGEPVANMVWTDTAHVKPGESIEILADLSNAGDWMFRSHIAELLQGGMAIILRVGS